MLPIIVPYAFRDAADAAICYAKWKRNSNPEMDGPDFTFALSYWWTARDELEPLPQNTNKNVLRTYNELAELINQCDVSTPSRNLLTRVQEKGIELLELCLDGRNATKLLTEMQQLIMDALDGKAMTQHELFVELNLGSFDTLRGKNGIGGMRELVAWKLVINSRRHGGYFRPDRPPE